MPKITPRRVENRVLSIYHPSTPIRHIKRLLLKENVSISERTIKNIIESRGKRRQAEIQGKKFKQTRSSPKMTPRVLKLVSRRMTVENPPTQTSIAQQFNVNQSTISRVIIKGLNMKRRKKRSVHVLSLKDRKNRMENCRRLYKNHLAGDKCRYVVTLDESYVRMRVDGATTSFCYLKKNEPIPDDWVKPVRSNFEQKIMIVGALSYYGAFPLIRIRRQTMDSHCYITEVLRPLVHKYIIPLFGGDTNKVFVHYDKATVHVSSFTQLYMDLMTEKYGIKFIPKDHIPVRGADCSPLDFFGFGYLKRKVEGKVVRNLDQLWKQCQSAWKQITPETCVKVYQSWKSRCRKIVERQGSHCEQLKSIHQHKNTLKSFE